MRFFLRNFLDIIHVYIELFHRRAFLPLIIYHLPFLLHSYENTLIRYLVCIMLLGYVLIEHQMNFLETHEQIQLNELLLICHMYILFNEAPILFHFLLFLNKHQRILLDEILDLVDNL